MELITNPRSISSLSGMETYTNEKIKRRKNTATPQISVIRIVLSNISGFDFFKIIVGNAEFNHTDPQNGTISIDVYI